MSSSTDLPASELEKSDSTPLQIIRTETVLSKLPIHNLAKTGRVDIRIERQNPHGQVELRWEVSYSDRYGQPRQLAYKLDTLVVNRRIDECGRPLPRVIRIGTLSSICRELGVPASGKNTNDLRRAFHQNAGTYITAKLAYRAADGEHRRLEAGFSRYSVVFTGESLPDGRKADAVYVILNEPYREVVNSAPVRPLDYDYLKGLRPAAQRFYEIISYRMFATLKHGRGSVKLSYSEYCMYSAQQRYAEAERFRVQMYKLHKPHLDSGYLNEVHIEQTTDAEGKPDWIMHYTPGPKARVEFATFYRGSTGVEPASAGEQQEQTEDGESQDPDLLKALKDRGISAGIARQLLAESVLDAGLIRDQVEWGDLVLSQSTPRKWRNPPGFYVWLIRERILPPDTFESSRKRKLRQQAESEQAELQFDTDDLEIGYEQYRRRVVDEYQSSLDPKFLADARLKAEWKVSRQYPTLPKATLKQMALCAVQADLAAQIGVLSFEEFRRQRAGAPKDEAGWEVQS